MKNDVLTALANNPALMEATKAVILKYFSFDTVTDGPNEMLGQQVRARQYGQAAVEKAFKEIATYQKSVDKPVTVNPAR